jgi:hypothetical protein
VEPFAVFLAGLLGLLAVLGLAAFGFAVLPRPYPPPGQDRRSRARGRPGPTEPAASSPPPAPQPFDPNLPAPVRRHFAEIFEGEQVLPVETAAVWGRGRANIGGVWMPLRFKSFYRVGREALRHYEISWYRQRLVTGRERYQQGQGSIELGGRAEVGVSGGQSLNLAMWAEAVWFPAALVSGLGWQAVSGPPESDWREHLPRWEAINEHSARLIIPLQMGETFRADQLVANFDPLSGRMTHLAGRRARRGERPPTDAELPLIGDAAAAAQPDELDEREPWRMDLLAWGRVPLYSPGGAAPALSVLLPVQAAVGWGESGAIGAYWTVEGVAYNMDVGEWIEKTR